MTDYYTVYGADEEWMVDWNAALVDRERDGWLITYDAPHSPQEVSRKDLDWMLKVAEENNATIRDGYYEPEEWTLEPAKDSADYLDGPEPTKMTKLTDKEINAEMVEVLNLMEGAMEILDRLRKDAGDCGPKLGKGEAELWKAYDIVSAKRSLKYQEATV